MSGQIDKMSDQNEDLKGHHVLLKKKFISSTAVPKINNQVRCRCLCPEERMKIETAWHPWIGGLGRRSLLVFDAFKAHVTDSMKSSFKREKTDLAVIPGGLL